MQKNNSIKTNYLFNMLLSYLDTLFPLITAPYISRALGAQNLGKVTFANSLVTCFIVLSAFGTTFYGIREISKAKNNQEELNKVFSELILIKIISSVLSLILYLFIIFSFKIFKQDLLLYIIMAANIIFSILTIDWLYQGLEEFKYITTRTGIMKLICLILMFVFIKEQGDYTKYAFIIIFGFVVTSLLSYNHSRNFVKITFKNINIRRHKTLYIFFISYAIYTFYLLFDQILLGFMSDSQSVAFLNRSKTIITMVTAIVTSLVVVLIPKASLYYNTNKERLYYLFEKSLNLIYLISIPCSVGIFCISYEIMLLLGGIEFASAYKILSAMSVTILLTAVRTLLKNQFLIPAGREKISLRLEFVATFFYLVLNIILIPKLNLWACVVSIVVYELISCIGAYLLCKRTEKFSLLNKSLIHATIGSVVMYVAIYFIKEFELHYVVSMGLSICVGATVYGIVLMAFKNEIILEVLSLAKLVYKKFF